MPCSSLQVSISEASIAQFSAPSSLPANSIARAVSPEERAQALKARAAMIERGSYAFGERVSALLAAAASPETIALVQQTLRATNPAGFMQAARFLAGDGTPPLGSG